MNLAAWRPIVYQQVEGNVYRSLKALSGLNDVTGEPDQFDQVPK